MKIASFGDSFLWGSDLPDQFYPNEQSELTWPALIAKKLNLEHECKAVPGSGNFLIYKNILESVKNNANCLFLINWTWVDRFDYSDISVHSEWNTVRPSLDNPVKDKFYYKNFHSELQDKLLSLTYIFSAIQILNISRCRFIMTYMDSLLLDQQWHSPDSVKMLQSSVSPYLHSFNGQNFLDWSKSNNFAISKHWHPMEQAHEAAAEFWLPKVRTLLNTTAKEE